MLTNKLNIPSLFWPSMLAVALALTACSDNSASSDNDSKTTTTDNSAAQQSSNNKEGASNKGADSMEEESALLEPKSVEQERIDTLSNYRWILSKASDSKNQPVSALNKIKEQVTLNFNQQGNNSLNYSVGCNIMSANFQLQGDTLSTEDSMSTKMSCGELDAAENLLNQLIQGDSQLKLIINENSDELPILTQVTNEGSTLTWRGKLTAQAKYNSKGETIFWAVAADSKPCQDNQSQLCLQVKPVSYDDSGIKTSTGDYVEFAGTIDGYEHDGKHNEVLRLQRYKTNHDTVLVDNIDSNYAYVLDTVIEKEVVN